MSCGCLEDPRNLFLFAAHFLPLPSRCPLCLLWILNVRRGSSIIYVFVFRQIVALLSTPSVLSWKTQEPGHQASLLFCSPQLEAGARPRRRKTWSGCHITCSPAPLHMQDAVMWGDPECGQPLSWALDTERNWRRRAEESRVCGGTSMSMVHSDVGGAILGLALNVHVAWPFFIL